MGGEIVHRDDEGRVTLVEGSTVVTAEKDRRGDRSKVESDNPQEQRYGAAEKPKASKPAKASSDD